jgi:competence protein ComEC
MIGKLALCIGAGAVLLAAQNGRPEALKIRAIDVEGGKSTLYVSPSGESMLIDTGYAGNGSRDANRIAAAAAAAGVKRIDYLVITHFHGDHAGGVPQLAAKIPIGKIYDHGDSFEKSNAKTQAVFQPYAALREKYPHAILRPGDRVPIKGLKVEVVAGAGDAIATSLAGAGQPNPLCSSYEALKPDPGENAHSLALIITFGKLRIADLGDLYWNQEHELACPMNKLGTVDLYMTTHHGTATSGSPQMVHALHPKVAIMNNGADKGGSKQRFAVHRGSRTSGNCISRTRAARITMRPRRSSRILRQRGIRVMRLKFRRRRTGCLRFATTETGLRRVIDRGR